MTAAWIVAFFGAPAAMVALAVGLVYGPKRVGKPKAMPGQPGAEINETLR